MGRDHDDVRDWLTGRIGAGIRMGLSTCKEMLDRLGNPESDYPSIHVAGTNGKGSLCSHLSSLGSRNGELVGLFTSPHLVSVEERARIDGAPIDPEALDRLLEEVREASLIEPRIHPTYFETTFLASMLAFSRSGVDRAVVETGLGGRLDATRLVEADICAITTISMDHSEILGGTLPEIATEKAGIHRSGVPLICLHHPDPGVRDAIESEAGRDLVWIETGESEAQEVARAMALEIGRRIGWSDLGSEVSWAGRTNEALDWQGVSCHLSAAHNSESLEHDIGRMGGIRHVLLLGMTEKHDLEEAMSPLSDCSGRARSIVTEVHGGRGPSVTGEDLARALSEASGEVPEVVLDPIDALDRAAEIAGQEGCRVLVAGSVYLVGQILQESHRREGPSLLSSMAIHPPRGQTEG